MKKFFEVASQKKCRQNPSYNMLLEEKSVEVDEVEILVKINEVYAGVLRVNLLDVPFDSWLTTQKNEPSKQKDSSIGSEGQITF